MLQLLVAERIFGTRHLSDQLDTDIRFRGLVQVQEVGLSVFTNSHKTLIFYNAA